MKKELQEKQQKLGITDDLIELEGMKPAFAIKLGDAGVKTRDDLADLAEQQVHHNVLEEEPAAQPSSTIRPSFERGFGQTDDGRGGGRQHCVLPAAQGTAKAA